VTIVGIKSQAHLNGCIGIVVDWDAHEGRWKVRMEDGSGKMFKTENLKPHDAPATALPSSPSQPAAPRESGEAGASPLGEGMRVRICGVESRPELNGMLGTLVQFSEGRWQVLVDDNLGKFNFRPANLQPCDASSARERPPDDSVPSASLMASREVRDAASDDAIGPGMQVCVVGLAARRDLNGQTATAVSWDDDEERWRVQMEDGSRKMFRVANLEPAISRISLASTTENLAPGTRVRISGSQGTPELNGTPATLVEWDRRGGLCKVRTDDGVERTFGPSNLSYVAA